MLLDRCASIGYRTKVVHRACNNAPLEGPTGGDWSSARYASSVSGGEEFRERASCPCASASVTLVFAIHEPISCKSRFLARCCGARIVHSQQSEIGDCDLFLGGVLPAEVDRTGSSLTGRY